MGLRDGSYCSTFRCSLLVSVLLVVAVGHLATAQSQSHAKAAAGRNLATPAASSSDTVSGATLHQQQRRRLQQQRRGQGSEGRLSQSQAPRYTPFSTNANQRNARGANSQGQSARTQQEPAATTPVLPSQPELSIDMSSTAAGIHPSILLMGRFDWQNIPDVNGRPWSRCLDMVWRARRLSRSNKINFVPTHHWIPRDDGFGVSRFCYMHKNPGIPNTVTTANGMYCSPWNDDLIQEFEDTMTSCMAEAIRQGFTPYIRPHLDDGLAKGIWRNGLMFGPNYVYGEYSYKQIMLDPLAKALNRALAQVAAENKLWPRQDLNRPVVYIALQGEMSATIMRYTSEWQALIPGIRSTIGNKHADVKIGIGLNFNALDAVEGGRPPPDGGLIGWLVGSGARASRYPVPSIDAAAVNKLVSQDIDFIGISAYAPYTGPGMKLNEFENSAFNVGESLKLLANGVNIATLINSGKLELHYSEFGLGGGNEGNARPASSAAMAGKQPWAGVAGYYNSAWDPWNVPELRNYRNEFFTKALQWLADPYGKTYRVCDVWIWGMASWDTYGIYPDYLPYRDLSLVQRFADHNMQVITAQVKAAKGSDNARLVLNQLQEINGQPEGITGKNVQVVNNEVKVTGGANYNAQSSGSYSTQSAPAPQMVRYAPAPAPAFGGFPWFFGR